MLPGELSLHSLMFFCREIEPNLALPVLSAFFHHPQLCCVLLFSIFLCSLLERGSTRTNQVQKALCPPASENTLALFLPLSVYLLHTASMSMGLSPVFSFQQCFISVPWPTHQNTTTGHSELLPLFGSFIVSNTQSPKSHSSFLYLWLPHQQSLSLNLHPFLPPSLKLVTSPNTHIAMTASGSSCSQGHIAKCWWRGQLTSPLCLGHQGDC